MQWGLEGHSSLILYLCSHCQIQKRLSSGSMDDRPSLSARDYVESLHQNSRATLLYGKNNVLVQPVRAHRGPRSSTGVWLHVIEKFPLALGCSFIHPSTYSPIYSFICQYFRYPFIHPYATISFIHASTCQYFLLPNPSMHPSTCQYLQPASLSLLLQCL